MTLIPVLGTDYSTRSEVLAAFVRGDVFSDEDTNTHVTRSDVEADGQTEVSVLYHGQSRRTTLGQVDGVWQVRP